MPKDTDFASLKSQFLGDWPLPLNVAITGDYHHGPDNEIVRFTQQVYDRAQLSRGINNVIDQVEEESLSAPALRFREAAAFIFVYKDGAAEAKLFTSNLPTRVESDIHYEAIGDSRILDDLDQGYIPRAVFHIHSHPGMEYKPDDKKDAVVLINTVDFRSYQRLSAFFSAYAGVIIPVHGLVKPVGRNCGNAVIETQATPYDPGLEMLIKANVLKGRRALQALAHS